MYFTGIALVWRLQGQVSCPMPEQKKEPADG